MKLSPRIDRLERAGTPAGACPACQAGTAVVGAGKYHVAFVDAGQTRTPCPVCGDRRVIVVQFVEVPLPVEAHKMAEPATT